VRVPRGPFTSTAEVGVSAFRERAFSMGRSKKRSETSGGIVIGSLPILEHRVRVVENVRDCVCRFVGTCSAGTRNEGTSWAWVACCRSLRKLGRRPVQAMVGKPFDEG
jgi:hypothetical protein